MNSYFKYLGGNCILVVRVSTDFQNSDYIKNCNLMEKVCIKFQNSGSSLKFTNRCLKF